MKPVERRIPGGVVLENGGYDRELALESIGAGWAPLIHKIFDKKEELNLNVRIIQVKEKWGGLRVYADYDDSFEPFIQEVMNESFDICEECGVAGSLRGNGWYKTLCDEHSRGRPVLNLDGTL